MYKLKLPIKWKIYDVFHVLLLEQNIIRKKRVDKALSKPEKDLKFEVGGNNKYEVKAIIESAIYSQQTNNSN